MKTFIRPATAKDIEAIRQTIQGAFAARSHLSNQESLIVDSLRESGGLALSLVAEREGSVIGYTATSPVQIEGSDQNIGAWYGLCPLAVHPEYQWQGVGSDLVKEALKLLREQGAFGCVVLGRPEFYTRFGFLQDHNLHFEGAPRKFLMAMPMKESMPAGTVKYHEAFNV